MGNGRIRVTNLNIKVTKENINHFLTTEGVSNT